MILSIITCLAQAAMSALCAITPRLPTSPVDSSPETALHICTSGFE